MMTSVFLTPEDGVYSTSPSNCMKIDSGARLVEGLIDVLPMPDPDDEDDQVPLVLSEDDPVAANSQAEQILDVPVQTSDIVLQGFRILGQDEGASP